MSHKERGYVNRKRIPTRMVISYEAGSKHAKAKKNNTREETRTGEEAGVV